ncbi:biotin--[acetyl-CoA-carboxylase] ligase [Saccharibacillus sp. CPCC 101409]|uniref:biotin--[acetyl-CoA-carboxylase] ligase n=1 Tax=Saccharibacillus sp. CPCC 101409 TaxID=3058041 RepID=UPI0026736DA9|nr:biotin--[acetyl-CoA-carboxylase] ligase [Saccharibacillus sp. CPCC 101409]MDO3409639.1 biotin--[acetyl-CoA-carboxylase] ligase [Saccharibacillus sp. CPCC 101409]
MSDREVPREEAAGSRDRLLDMFEAAAGQYLSGEEISRRLGVSRTAVWKQIRRLKDAGYVFDAAPKLGYRLAASAAALDARRIEASLRTRRFGRSLTVLARTDSTQTEAENLARAGAPEGTLVVAEEQTSGRGRQGRVWHSPPGRGVWMSAVLRPEGPLTAVPQLTLLAAVAVCRAIRAETGVQAGIKWPNDLLADGRKLCGILLEAVVEDGRVRHCIMGIGIDANLEEADYPEELRQKVTSLRRESGKEVDRSALIAAVMNEFESLLSLHAEHGFQPIRLLWESLSVTLGREIVVRDARGERRGRAAGLGEQGELRLETEDGEVLPVYSGDIELYPGRASGDDPKER